MKRVTEPELMDGEAQVLAYARADFSEAHDSYVRHFAEVFPVRPARATVLDLGCGPCDVTMRFARANPDYEFHAVDGSRPMLRLARHELKRDRALTGRVRLIEGFIPGASVPLKCYDVILSTSFLHHLPEPGALWQSVRRFSKRGTLVMVADLVRPATRPKALGLVRQYARGAPQIARRDFYNSLLAAFTVDEVTAQLEAAGLGHLTVRTISDRHLTVTGVMRG